MIRPDDLIVLGDRESEILSFTCAVCSYFKKQSGTELYRTDHRPNWLNVDITVRQLGFHQSWEFPVEEGVVGELLLSSSFRDGFPACRP